MDKRDVVQGLIGAYAEALVYIFCTMDLASLDATLRHPPGTAKLFLLRPMSIRAISACVPLKALLLTMTCEAEALGLILVNELSS